MDAVTPQMTLVPPPPNPWWQEFDRALAHGLRQGWSALRAEDYAKEQAELRHPGGMMRDVAIPEPDPDPNEDLVGFEFAGIRVTGTASWNPAYVTVETPSGPSCRAAALVRARKLRA